MTDNNVTSVFEDKRKEIWVGTWGGSLNIIKDGAVYPFSFALDPVPGLVLSLLQDRQGDYWVGTDFNGGLFKRNGDVFLRFASAHGFVDTAIRVLYEDSLGNLWAGTSSGLNLFSNNTFFRFTKDNGLAGNTIRALCDDGQGGFWIGTTTGLSRHQDGEFFPADPALKLSSINLSALYRDRDGTLWVGTDGGGLNRIRNGRVRAWDSNHGLFDDRIYEILEDDTGWFWFASSRGVFRARKSNFLSDTETDSDAIICYSYGREDGLGSTVCNGVGKPSAWRGREGRLWFATARGVSVVNPAQVPLPPTHPPRVWIEAVFAGGDRMGDVRKSAFGPRQDGGVPLEIPPGRRDLSFRYTVLSFRSVEKNRFRYRLEGWDKDWVDAGARREAYYNNLPPGTYQFQVIGAGSDGLWNTGGATITVKLLPYFWQTPWFLGIALLLTGGGLGSAVRFVSVRKLRRKLEQIEQQRAVENERSRIARDMHDELGARLSSILLLSNLARKPGGASEEMRNLAEKISGQTQDIVERMDAIVWAVNPGHDTLERFASYLFENVEMYLESTGLRFIPEVPENLPECPLSSEIRHNLYLVVREALHNVVKHADATEVTVRLQLEASLLSVSVEDNGCGFKAEPGSAFGNGLKNMQDRMRNIGGTLLLSNRPGGGTRVRAEVRLVGWKASNHPANRA